MDEREPVGVIGAGWVGLVTAACFAELGHEIWCRDIVAEKVESLRRGHVPIHEPGLPELLARNRERVQFTTELGPVLEHARLLFCCVDTPPTVSGDADLSRVHNVVDEIGDSDQHALVMKSTVPVGTGRAVARRRDGLGYVANPEFLREGNAVDDFLRPDRVVIGTAETAASDAAADRVEALYRPLGAEIVRTDVASAEMIKLASNAFLATKISFINEIANVSEEVGADVAEVARGMGLDERIGPQFLQPGIGYGGSCLAGDETVLLRQGDRTWLMTLEELFEQLEDEAADVGGEPEVLYPAKLETLSWREGDEAPEFRPVAAVTRRRFDGDMVHVRTKMGRRVRCTPDHPFVVGDGRGEATAVRTADRLDDAAWLPIAQGAPPSAISDAVADIRDAYLAAEPELEPGDVIVRAVPDEVAKLASVSSPSREAPLDHPGGAASRIRDIARTGALRLDELRAPGLSAEGATLGTARNGMYSIPATIELDAAFWRIVGLYLAEGHCSTDGRRQRLQWSFHPTGEPELVDEVARFWTRRGVKASVSRRPATTCVSISSRLLAGWWIGGLGLGRRAYEQRVPDQIWARPEEDKRALLSGMWAGDGSWSYVARGPSVVLEYGTVSRELADGTLRLLGDIGIVARVKVGRTRKSTRDTFWIGVSGADQIERAIDLVPRRQRAEVLASVRRQAKRIAATGYRRHSPNGAWVRVSALERRPFRGHVYCLEVPDAETFVTTGGLVVHNCFPKDVSALKQLAGNSGYHFQLLTSVIEVNELQKRRTIGKLQKHLGSLVGREIALLGLAFKPNTDDLREATSLVLAARLHGEGARVRAYDPVAGDNARGQLGDAQVAATALEALEGADAAVLVTEWPEFAELDWEGEVKSRMARPLVVDGRNFLDGARLRAAGFTYEGVGRR